MNTDRLALMLFIGAAMAAAFTYGAAANRFNLFPYSTIAQAFDEVAQLRAPPHFLHPARYDGSGVRIHDRAAVNPGITLITSYWPEHDWNPGVSLIDVEGNELHHWETRPAELWPTSPHDDGMPYIVNKADNYVHGSYLFPNGDLLVNLEYLGLVRMDSCGEVVWKLPYRTHHSISLDDDGNFWVSGAKWRSVAAEGAPAIVRPPYKEDFVLKVSPEGEILREISVLDALVRSGNLHLLWKYKSMSDDLTHLNDVEALGRAAAQKFPEFEAGDLVVSLKQISSIVVLDQMGRVKWLDSYHFNRQHDPDFEDGRIVVFDNREDGTDTGEHFGGSVLASVNPTTGEYKQLYPLSGSERFFTNAGGKHQLLPNGNRLVTEVRAGRVFEIDSSGRTVWEWIQQPNDGNLVAEVMEGSRYGISPDTVAAWQCN